MLSIKNLSKSYNKLNIFKNIDLEINDGEIVSLVGESGSGKSTLLKCISGLIDFECGNVFINSENITKIPTYKRNIGYVFQDSPLLPHLTSIENILINIKKFDTQKLNFLLKRLQIIDLKNRFPYQLSGGESQRIAVARSLIREPDLFLLDEPFSNLDFFNKNATKEIVYDTIKKIKTTTIFVSHDINDSLEISDRVIAIEKNKKKLIIDTPLKIYNDLSNLEVSKIFGYVNTINTGTNIINCRPENIKIVDKSNIQLTTIKSNFSGPFYKIIAKDIDSNMIYLNSQKYIESNEKIFVKIDLYNN